MTRIAVFCSGGGTNLQALIDAWHAGALEGGKIALVVASKPGIQALQRAADNSIPSVTVVRKNYTDAADYDDALIELLRNYQIGLVVLAGFVSILGPKVLTAYENRIMNVHPSLIPAFCGKGFYGLHVHEAVLEYGVKITGATVHFVDAVVDGGKIILQKAIEVYPGDTPESLQLRVMREGEWELLPKAVAMFCAGKL